MPENYEATICPDCGRTNPVSQKQCTCGAILGVKTCVECGKTMISAAGNRQNIYTGEVQFFVNLVGLIKLLSDIFFL